MPARNEYGNKTKKKKGRAPTHQNKFAFKHNPSSKKTEKILSTLNAHVCQRCHDKIEWRKKYRKYKPRTQPGKCNECPKRNVKAAYHTICTDCTTKSEKAKALIRKAREESPELDENNTVLRACAVCVKEIALPDPPEDDDDRDYVDAMSRLNLRQKRALERKIAKEQLEVEKEKKSMDRDDDNDDDDDNESENEGPRRPSGSSAQEASAADDDGNSPDYGDDDDDPFLKAIGGADKLLTGEAYQRKLLQQLEKDQQ